MYLAKLNSFQIQAPFYITILRHIINGNEAAENKEHIDFAIHQAVDVAKGTLNIFSIDNNYYFFVTTLLSNYNEELLTIDQNIHTKIYSDILDILE